MFVRCFAGRSERAIAYSWTLSRFSARAQVPMDRGNEAIAQQNKSAL